MEATAEKTAITMAAGNAIQKGSIEKPGTSQVVKRRITAEMTRLKRPKVIMVIGNVRIVRIGLTKAFRTASTRATTTAVQKDSTLKPGTR